MRFFSIAVLCGLFVFCAVLLRIVTQFDGTHPEYPVECGLVFGAAVGKGSTPSRALTRRVEKAAELYNAKYIKTLIFSGGKGSEWQESEAAVMRKVAMLNGVDPDDIYLEEESTSTWENLEFSKSIADEHCGASYAESEIGSGASYVELDERSEASPADSDGRSGAGPAKLRRAERSGVDDRTAVIAISDRYHLARILQLANQQNWGDLESAPARKSVSPLSETKSVLREAVGIIFYALNGDSLRNYWENQEFAF
ncbi:MAG: YdcF family protein [Kiritimatiellales bacterium]|nr:YdcF family protein [Kiritimatiellales bacterium]